MREPAGAGRPGDQWDPADGDGRRGVPPNGSRGRRHRSGRRAVRATASLPRARGATDRDRLYTPTWWEERAPWLLDVLIALDPAPLARMLRPVAVLLRWPIELLCTPLAAGLDLVASGLRAVRRLAGRIAGGVARALPLPGSVRDWLWLRPIRLDGTPFPSAQALWHRRGRRLAPVALALGILLHAAALVLWPPFTLEVTARPVTELAAIEIPPEIVIPPAPEALPRPAVPVIALTDVAEDVTIAPTTFAENPVAELPPPRSEEAAEVRPPPTITPYTVAPQVLNPAEVRTLLTAEYPRVLRQAGVGGEVLMWFFVDETGSIGEIRIARGSGHDALDAAALRVGERIRFSPAINRDQRVATWVQFPLIFSVR